MAAPMPYRYLSEDEVWTINSAILSQERNASLLRDRIALSGALMRPQMAAHYEQADLVTQAAILISAIAHAHVFLDGNKRTALVAGVVFLDLNGFQMDISPSDDMFGRQIEALLLSSDSIEIAERHFGEWLRAHVTPKR